MKKHIFEITSIFSQFLICNYRKWWTLEIIQINLNLGKMSSLDIYGFEKTKLFAIKYPLTPTIVYLPLKS